MGWDAADHSVQSYNPATGTCLVSKQSRQYEQMSRSYQSRIPVHTCTPQNSALKGVAGIPLAGFHTT